MPYVNIKIGYGVDCILLTTLRGQRLRKQGSRYCMAPTQFAFVVK